MSSARVKEKPREKAKSEVVDGVSPPALPLCGRAELRIGIVYVAQQNHVEMRHGHLGMKYFENNRSSLGLKMAFILTFILAHALHFFQIADGLR